MTEAERLVQELQGESEWLRSPTQTDSVWMERRLNLTADLCVEAAALLRAQAAEIEALREANERFGKRQKWWTEKMFSLEQERDSLRADAERWRAYRRNVAFTVKMKGTTLHCGGHPFINLDEYGPAVDAAIDAAGLDKF